MKFYYKCVEATDYIEKKRRGLAARMNVCALNECIAGYWPIYYLHSNKYPETEEKAREYIQNVLDSWV